MFKAVFMCNGCGKEADGRFIEQLPQGWMALTKDLPKGHYRENVRTAEWHFCCMPCVAAWTSNQVGVSHKDQ